MMIVVSCEMPSGGNLSIFSNPELHVPKNVVSERYLFEIEFIQAYNYMLFNCDELRSFIQYVYYLNFMIN